MHPTPLKLLRDERICVLSLMLSSGMPHNAVVHYSLHQEPLRLLIQTYPTLKTEAIDRVGGSTNAAVVVGLSEEEFISLQMHGTIRILLEEAELSDAYAVHYQKFPEAEKHKSASTIFLEFTPTWWRYSDFKVNPETIIASV
jgi:hypothetical protein